MIMSFMYIFSMSDIEVRLNLFSLCAILLKNVIFSSHKSIVVGKRYSAKIKTLIVLLVNNFFSERHAFVSHYFFTTLSDKIQSSFTESIMFLAENFKLFSYSQEDKNSSAPFFSKLNFRVCFG